MSSAARAYKASGFVLRARNLGEADKIVTLFTDVHGKVDAVAKGVRRTKSHLAGRLEFMTEAAFNLHRGRNLDVITGAEIVRGRWPAILEPRAFATAHLLAELIDSFCELDLALPEVYALLGGALEALAVEADPPALVPRFELRLLAALGFAPVDEGCVRCGTPFGGRSAWADLDGGGLACERCRPHRSDLFALEPAEITNFRALGAPRGGAVRPARVAMPAAARAIDAFVAHHLGKRPKSLRYLAELHADSFA